MPGPEQPFTALEQTTPGPMMMTALWPFADVPKKMALVHGSPYSRCSSLEAKRQLRFEALFTSRLAYLSIYKKCQSRDLRPAPWPGTKRVFVTLSKRY
jgi:hypothetical protein